MTTKKIITNIANIQIKWFEIFGYIPEALELKKAYTDGDLILTDSEEDSLLTWFDIKKL